MVDKAINDYFQDRKEAWLKKALNASMIEAEVKEKELECDQVFALEQWLPNAAKRAGQISISTHPCTFSHPSSRKSKNGYVSSIIAASKRAGDGYLRSGNVEVNADALGNAAALDVYKFLMLNLDNGQTLLNHIQQDSELAQRLFDIKAESYQTLKSGFLAMIQSDIDSVITSSRIKQIYFPVEDHYHQLSILSASGLMFGLRKRIDTIRFSEETKVARACEKANKMHTSGYLQLLGLTTIGYGGTKPQNISVLNNQNGGKVHLLSSAPPKLHKRDIQFPSTDFFSQSINYYQCRDLFYALHELFLKYKNNWQIRAERDEYYHAILDRIIEKMWLVRNVSETQYNGDTSRLNKTQKIWLCAENKEKRETENGWLDDLCKIITSFMFHGYAKIVGKKAIMFSDEEYKYIHKQIVKNRAALG
jgi:CRISPR-associated protein Csy1